MRPFGRRLLAALAALGLAASAQAATVNLSGSSSHVSVGSAFSLALRIDGLHQGGIGSLAGFDIDLHYDDSLLQFTGYSFIDPGSGSNPLDLPEPGGLGFFGQASVAGAGLLDAFGLSGNSTAVLDAGQPDAFRFLELNFVALQASSGTDLALDLADPLLLFADGAGNPIAIDFGASRTALVIDAQGGGSLPEPGSAALSLAGLAVALSTRRRRMGAAALALAAVLVLPGAALAQSAKAEPTPIDVLVVQVAGGRAKVRADDGREFWVTVGAELSADRVGQRLRGQAVPRGDSIKVSGATFAPAPAK
jgi:hypothetical protein